MPPPGATDQGQAEPLSTQQGTDAAWSHARRHKAGSPASRKVIRQVSFGMYSLSREPLKTYSTTASERPARCRKGRNCLAFWVSWEGRKGERTLETDGGRGNPRPHRTRHRTLTSASHTTSGLGWQRIEPRALASEHRSLLLRPEAEACWQGAERLTNLGPPARGDSSTRPAASHH